MKRSLSLQRRCAYFLAECINLGWRKDQLPALEKMFWKHKPWRTKATPRERLSMANAIGRLAMTTRKGPNESEAAAPQQGS